MAYNSQPLVDTLSAALAMDPALRQNAVTRFFERQSEQHNALEQFTTVFNPRTMVGGGPKSIFCKRTDLSKGGAQTVVFNTIGTPGGPGVRGDTELTGNTSTAQKGTYTCTIDWVRDAVEMTKDEILMLAAGVNLEEVQIEQLAQKLGVVKQNDQLKRLINDADGNVYRPNNRTSTNALLATDVLTLDLTSNAKARLTTLGAKPLKRDTAKSGCPIDNYMLFASSQALLPIRNDSSFQTILSNADNRGDSNSLFTGELIRNQGNWIYDFPVTDQDWDDFKGGPLIPKALLGTGFGTASAAGNTKLITNSANTLPLYYQWFGGYQYRFNRVETLPDYSAVEYYAWIINPDGSLGFVAYNGNHNGNQILITKILALTAGTSTKGTNTVGELVTNGSTAFTGGSSTLPISGPNGNWNYTSTFVAGAVIIQANSKGVPYTRSFMFGAMAGVFASGMVELNQIEQKRDYDFVKGKGYEMLFGTAVVKNAFKKPCNYLLIEHALEHEGYPVPSKL